MNTTTGYKIEDAQHPLYLSGLGRGFHELRGFDPKGEGIDSAELLKRAGLDWTVEQKKIRVVGSGGEQIASHVANTRSDNGAVIGVVGKGYTPLDNADGFSFADQLVQSGNGGWLTATALNGGSTVVALMKLNRDIKIAGMDSETILPLLAFRNGHDGGTSVSMRITPLRLVCLNGMLLPVKDMVRTWKARHTRSVRGRVDDARVALQIAWTYYDELEELGNKLVAKKVNDKAFRTFLDRLVPLTPQMEADQDCRAAKNRDEAIQAITGYWNGENLANVKGTAWGALQAVGEYADWDRPVRNTTRTTAEENRFVRVTKESKIKDRAVELLVA